MTSLRVWATPLVVGSFLIMGVSGVLMFFHANTGPMKVVHDWAGWALVVGATAHIVLYWRAFTSCFKRPLAVTLVSAGAVVLALSFLPGGSADAGPDGPDGPDRMRALMMSVGNARVETLAELAGKDTATVLARLGAAGYDAEAGQTLGALAGGDRATQDAIVNVVLAKWLRRGAPPQPRVRLMRRKAPSPKACYTHMWSIWGGGYVRSSDTPRDDGGGGSGRVRHWFESRAGAGRDAAGSEPNKRNGPG